MPDHWWHPIKYETFGMTIGLSPFGMFNNISHNYFVSKAQHLFKKCIVIHMQMDDSEFSQFGKINKFNLIDVMMRIGLFDTFP